MNNPPLFIDRISQVLQPTERGVVGLVDGLLRICREHDLQLDWHAGRCRVRATGSGPEEFVEVPLPKSVFRAILARLAALCNERSPGSVSPYGGEGELTIDVERASARRVVFTNTMDDQGVRLTRIENEPVNGLLLEGFDSCETKSQTGPDRAASAEDRVVNQQTPDTLSGRF
jgi:hypothetical protein